MPTREVVVASLVLDLDDDDAEAQPAACKLHPDDPACSPLSPTATPHPPPATRHPRLTLVRCMTSGLKK